MNPGVDPNAIVVGGIAAGFAVAAGGSGLLGKYLRINCNDRAFNK
jgi:hypothetical protein